VSAVIVAGVVACLLGLLGLGSAAAAPQDTGSSDAAVPVRVDGRGGAGAALGASNAPLSDLALEDQPAAVAAVVQQLAGVDPAFADRFPPHPDTGTAWREEARERLAAALAGWRGVLDDTVIPIVRRSWDEGRLDHPPYAPASRPIPTVGRSLVGLPDIGQAAGRTFLTASSVASAMPRTGSLALLSGGVVLAVAGGLTLARSAARASTRAHQAAEGLALGRLTMTGGLTVGHGGSTEAAHSVSAAGRLPAGAIGGTAAVVRPPATSPPDRARIRPLRLRQGTGGTVLRLRLPVLVT